MRLIPEEDDKMMQVERVLAQKHGPFTVFALLEREDSFGRWDVVVSAPWLGTAMEDIRLVAKQVTKLLSVQEVVTVSRIVPLPPESEFVQLLLREVRRVLPDEDGGPRRLGRSIVGDVELRRGYVLAAAEFSATREKPEALAA